jgi:pimeloyl-ACP methyl ester carboxylesterase
MADTWLLPEMDRVQFLAGADGSRLAYRHQAGKTPGILFLPGFNSDMHGTKALELDAWCTETGHQFTRFDYYGHGQSSGRVEEGCIGRWRDDALAVLDQVTKGPQLLVGSSMGGWIMLLAALARSERLCGLVGLAAAPDFTARLAQDLTAEQRQQLASFGYADLPNCYDDAEPYRIGRQLLEEGSAHLLLGKEIPVDLPVRLIQGQRDEDVPWRTALELAEYLRSDDVLVQLVKHGDHRLSKPGDLRRLRQTVAGLLHELAGSNGAAAGTEL